MLVQTRSFAKLKLSLILTDWDVEEQQLRFAFLQVGQVFVLATGSIANFGVSDPRSVTYPLL